MLLGQAMDEFKSRELRSRPQERQTQISDVKIIEPVVFGDERGFFMETWQQKKFCEKICLFYQNFHLLKLFSIAVLLIRQNLGIQ